MEVTRLKSIKNLRVLVILLAAANNSQLLQQHKILPAHYPNATIQQNDHFKHNG